MANPPGVNVTVNTPTSSPATNAATGTWFVTGYAAGGPSGVAVPINSIQDLDTYFGTISNGLVTSRTSASALLYDSLDVYFREGGIRAYVSRTIGTVSGTAATSVIAGSGSGTWLTFTATGKGTWANSSSSSAAGLIITVATSGSGYTLSVAYNGNQLGSTSPTLFTANDAVNWVNSLAAPGILCTAVAGAGTGIPASGAKYFTSGADSTSTDAGTDVAAALVAFGDTLGAGQVSAPGIVDTSGASVYAALTNHAIAYNRVAVLDAPNTSTVSTLTTAASVVQTGGSSATSDSSFAAMFGPWVKVPGIASTTPNTVAPTFTRTVPASPFAAANMAANDTTNDCNVPAAGVQSGSCTYATDVVYNFVASDRVTLNNAGVNLLRNINGAVAVYGYRSLATDTNWTALNNVRFRMQILRDFDNVVEPFVFAEIDGKGQIFARLAGALSGQCQAYWLRNSLYGATPDQAFSINVGPQVNTPTTIAAGQLNAQVNVRMSPQAEQVSITVTKYLVTAPLPTY